MGVLWRIVPLLVGTVGIAQAFHVPSMVLKVPSTFPPVVILPGFGNDARDYHVGAVTLLLDKDLSPLKGGDERAFASALERRGLSPFVVPVRRQDWLQVGSAIFTADFWSGTCRPDGPAYSWYLQKVKETVADCREATGSDRVLLVGHSAGGWLARAALGGGEWEDGVSSEEVVAGLVTLGTPHFAGPMDMTRGALRFTSEEYPGAFLKDRGVFYVTVAGAAVKGDKTAPRNSRRRFAYGSYETVCGEGATMGDACVPLVFAHLEGAQQITLDGVFHSVDKPEEWYGADGVVDSWLGTVVKELRPTTPRKQIMVALPEPFANLFRSAPRLQDGTIAQV